VHQPKRRASLRNLASTVFMLVALLLAACAQGMAGSPAGPHGPPYDSGDKDGGGSAGCSRGTADHSGQGRRPTGRVGAGKLPQIVIASPIGVLEQAAYGSRTNSIRRRSTSARRRPHMPRIRNAPGRGVRGRGGRSAQRTAFLRKLTGRCGIRPDGARTLQPTDCYRPAIIRRREHR
jgi:hypothetical protein